MIFTQSGLLHTMNLSQGVEIQAKQSPQIQNTDYVTLNQGGTIVALE
jgi:hypothetical protein